MSILIAYDENKNRIHINDYNGQKIYCAEGHQLMAKRGDKKSWHYSHKTGTNCSSSKGKTDFHLYWQNRVNKDNLEVKLIKDDILHIADIINNHSKIIEIQHSPIKQDVIEKRESFYDNMCWIFDGTSCDFEYLENQKNILILLLKGGSSYFLEAKKESYLDLGHRGLLEIIRIKGKKLLCRKRTLHHIDKHLFHNICKDDRDKRLDKPEYNITEKATNDEVKILCKKHKI